MNKQKTENYLEGDNEMKNFFTLISMLTLVMCLTYNVMAQEWTNDKGDEGVFSGPMAMGNMNEESMMAQNPPEPADMETPNDDPMMGQNPRGPKGMGMMRGNGPMMDRPPKGMGMGMMLRPEMMDKIGLTKEQKDSIESIFIANRKEMITKKAEHDLAQVELQDLMRKDKPDMNLVKTQIQKIFSIQGDMQYAQIKVMMDAKNILTDEQKANLEKLMKEQKDQVKDNTKDNAKNDKKADKAKPDGKKQMQKRGQDMRSK
jgi:Spy/CpxP family protein refolding chaperone